jgi:hypothetical protein
MSPDGRMENVPTADDHAWPFRIVVSGGRPIQLVLEPWADEYTVTPESTVDLVVYGPLAGRPPEFVHEPDRLEVWAPAGCTAVISIDGMPEDGPERPRVPNIRGLGGTE